MTCNAALQIRRRKKNELNVTTEKVRTETLKVMLVKQTGGGFNEMDAVYAAALLTGGRRPAWTLRSL